MINNRNSQEHDSSGSKKDKVSDIDDFNVLETIVRSSNNNLKKKGNEKDRKLSHDRKPSYSSSEKSLTINGNALILGGGQPPATINPVKLRESSSIRRQRRGLGLITKDEPHSSSGNWSASSESGRTSIGSEITTTTAHPKSSASSTSLNHNNHPPSSGPPSSIISRRRFLNTSASSSITSEGTATPELQMCDFHDEGETSSVYSCDTEGYYTSFHVDSGLKTLKEEEPITPMHSSMALSSTTSFESSGNQTVISPENEYEMFGRGSTSTTTSSAGTVCTAVLSQENERYSNGPCVPERKSSLTKLNRSNSSASSGTLERSYSSSTVGSTLEKSGTIKRNGVLLQKEVAALVHQHQQETVINRTESPDSGNNTSSSPVESNSNSSPTQGVRSYSEFEYSESSDLECVDRIERIRVKTKMSTARIPSMCVITPNASDDESANKKKSEQEDEPKEINIKIKENSLALNKETGYVTLLPSPTAPLPTPSPAPIPEFRREFQHFKKATLLPLNNMLGKLKGVLKKSPNKETVPEPVYDSAGEYVTIKDINGKKSNSNGVYYSNDVVKRNLATVLSGNLNEETEYVSLNELPSNIRSESNLLAIYDNDDDEILANDSSSKKIDKTQTNGNCIVGGDECGSTKEMKMRGARVTLDAHGKVIYSSDSLKRRKGAYTTFTPGPHIRDDSPQMVNSPPDTKATSSPLLSGGVANRKAGNIRPVVSQKSIQNVDSVDTVVEQENTVIRASESPTNLNTNNNNITDSISNNNCNNNNSINTNNSNNLNIGQNNKMQQSPIIASGVLKGAYVNVLDAAPLRNGPPIYTPPGVYNSEGKNSFKPKIISCTPKNEVKLLKSFAPRPLDPYLTPKKLFSQKSPSKNDTQTNVVLKSQTKQSSLKTLENSLKLQEILGHLSSSLETSQISLKSLNSQSLLDLLNSINENPGSRESIKMLEQSIKSLKFHKRFPQKILETNFDLNSSVEDSFEYCEPQPNENTDPNASKNTSIGIRRRDSYRLANSPIIYAISNQLSDLHLSSNPTNFNNSVVNEYEVVTTTKIDKSENVSTHSPNSIVKSSSSSSLNRKFMRNSKVVERAKNESFEKLWKLSQESLMMKIGGKKSSFASKEELNSDDNLRSFNISKAIMSSFEQLMRDFTISSNSIISTDISLNESLNSELPVKSKSLDDLLKKKQAEFSEDEDSPVKKTHENSNDSEDDFLDTDMDFVFKPTRNSAPMYLPSPTKVCVPEDSREHRARVLSTDNPFITDIW